MLAKGKQDFLISKKKVSKIVKGKRRKNKILKKGKQKGEKRVSRTFFQKKRRDIKGYEAEKKVSRRAKRGEIAKKAKGK